MEKEKKRSFAVLGDSYDNEPFIFDCSWIDKPQQKRKGGSLWDFGKVITQTR